MVTVLSVVIAVSVTLVYHTMTISYVGDRVYHAFFHGCIEPGFSFSVQFGELGFRAFSVWSLVILILPSWSDFPPPPTFRSMCSSGKVATVRVALVEAAVVIILQEVIWYFPKIEGTPIQTLIYYSPYDIGTSKKVSLILGNPHIAVEGQTTTINRRHHSLVLGADSNSWTIFLTPNRKGPRTQIMGFYGPNTINIMVFGP